MNTIDHRTTQLDFGQSDLGRTEIAEIPIRTIRPDSEQPRMALYGLLQPVGVRKAAADTWELIFGERRYRAALSLGWETIPARIFPAEARKFKTVLQFGENAHRADLSLLEYLGGIEQLRDLGVPAGAMARMLCKPDEWVAAMMDISREPLARSLYEAGIMTQVGAWEAFCRLPEHLRRGLLQSGEQLTIQRCKKVLDAHEAQMSARQQGLLQEPTSRALPSLARSSAPDAQSNAPEKTTQIADDHGAFVEPCDADEQGDVCAAVDRALNETITVTLPLWLVRALVPQREAQLQQLADWMPSKDGFPDAVRTALIVIERDLIQVLTGLAGCQP